MLVGAGGEERGLLGGVFGGDKLCKACLCVGAGGTIK